MSRLRVSRDTPLSEITLRRYEKPMSQGRELIKKVCLSLGLLQPGDSRDVIVDILHTLLKAKKEKEELHSEEVKNKVMEQRKNMKLPMLGIASSNIRRQLKRLKNMHLIESKSNLYRINEWATFTELFDQKIKPFYVQNITERVKEYLQRVDEHY